MNDLARPDPQRWQPVPEARGVGHRPTAHCGAGPGRRERELPEQPTVVVNGGRDRWSCVPIHEFAPMPTVPSGRKHAASLLIKAGERHPGS